MTNVKGPKADRKNVLEKEDIERMLNRAESFEKEYFKLRSRALVSLFVSGKRRAEVASLEKNDLEHKNGFLYVTFSVVKKRRKNVLVTRRSKRYPVSSKYAQHIFAYLSWMEAHHPECRYLFPSTHNVFGVNLAFSKDQHVSGRQVLREVQKMDPNAWCHLFRETRGAEVVRKDESEKGHADFFTVYKVKQTLNLERTETAWRYVDRYATETLGEAHDTID